MTYDRFYGWVGKCDRCGGPWLIFSAVTYLNGELVAWDTTTTGPSARSSVTLCTNVPCYSTQPYGYVVPLKTMKEQEPYLAAFALGGEGAVWTMLGIES